jgi:hypothetical protein
MADRRWRVVRGLPGRFNFINLVSCSSGVNYGRFCHPTIEAKVRRALKLQLQDPAAASKAWAALDREVTDQAPCSSTR